MTLDELAARPEAAAATIALADGGEIRLRPLRADDARLFGGFLTGLSKETTSLFAPHGFDQATADEICGSLDHGRILRLVGEVRGDFEPRLMAYYLLSFAHDPHEVGRYAKAGLTVDEGHDCRFAPCLADDFQGRGVGGPIARHMIDVARRLGRRWMLLWGGVQARNAYAIRYYEKLGFRHVADFVSTHRGYPIDNHDMYLEL